VCRAVSGSRRLFHHGAWQPRAMTLARKRSLCNNGLNKVTTGEDHMRAILGSGEHRYRVVENWAKLPPGWSLTDVASVAVDSKDRVYLFNRGAHPMVVLDRQ